MHILCTHTYTTRYLHSYRILHCGSQLCYYGFSTHKCAEWYVRTHVWIKHVQIDSNIVELSDNLSTYKYAHTNVRIYLMCTHICNVHTTVCDMTMNVLVCGIQPHMYPDWRYCHLRSKGPTGVHSWCTGGTTLTLLVMYPGFKWLVLIDQQMCYVPLCVFFLAVFLARAILWRSRRGLKKVVSQIFHEKKP